MVVTATVVSGAVLTTGIAVLVSFAEAGRVVSAVEALDETVLSGVDSGVLLPQDNSASEKQNKTRKSNKNFLFILILTR